MCKTCFTWLPQYKPLTSLGSFAKKVHQGCKGLSRGFPGDSDGKDSTCNAGDLGLIPGLGRSSEEGNGNSLQCSIFFSHLFLLGGD